MHSESYRNPSYTKVSSLESHSITKISNLLLKCFFQQSQLDPQCLILHFFSEQLEHTIHSQVFFILLLFCKQNLRDSANLIGLFQFIPIMAFDNLLSIHMADSEQNANHQKPAKPHVSISSFSSSSVHSSQNHRNGIVQRERSASSQNDRISRSRSRHRKRSSNGKQSDKISISVPQNNGQREDRGRQDFQKEASQQQSLKKITSKLSLTKDDKNKKKKVQRQYLTDFSQFLPEAMLLISRTNVTPKIRTGERYQAVIQTEPKYKSQIRSLQQWKIWNGSSCPQEKPTEEHLWRFKQLLGQNRNEEELISLRTRMGNKSWREVLQYVANNKTQLRRVFHNAQRNRLL